MRLLNRYNPVSLIAALAMVVLFSATAGAENAIRYSNAIVQPGGSFVIDMVMQNDVVIAGAVVPFRWSSPDITLEAITIIRDRFQGTVVDSIIQPDEADRTSGVFWVSGIGLFDRGWVNPGSGVLAQLHFRVSPFAADQIAYVDSVNTGSGRGITQYSNFAGTQVIFPSVYRGTIQIGNAGGDSRLDVRPEAMEFFATAGGDNPTPRSLTIASEGPFTLGWQAAWRSGWLSLSMTSGVTSSFPSVEVDIEGLGGGLYRDTIVITSVEAVNSPVLVPIELVVTQPDITVIPLQISLFGTIFPPEVDSRSFFLSSAGSGELAWDAFWSSTWLRVTPSGGLTPFAVDVSADITGLEAGTYEDEIVINAPGSANSPIFVQVTFQLDSTRSGGQSRVRLAQNVPNPFGVFGERETRIKFYVETPVNVDLAIYDLLGRRVRTLVSGSRSGGDHEVAWDGRNDDGTLVGSGHYFYRIMTPLGEVTRRVVLIK